ncbi:DUF1501 domain-containing protein [Bacteriovoracales bacterium]|nr:DUF1501 domain-containing protein [Bacteriovoracales bacterium]
MNRRDFFKATGLLTLYPQLLFSKDLPKRRLILIKLAGGNDGLNTLVPFQDDLYYKLRPKIALKKESLLKINSELGLHPGLKKVHSLFKEGKTAIIQGIGMPSPNLSHFRAMDIIETGSNSNEVLTKGWIIRALEQEKRNYELNGIVLGNPHLGPLQGDNLKSLSLKNLKFFQRSTKKLQDIKLKELSNLAKENEALRHILNVEKSLQMSSQKIGDMAMEKMEIQGKSFPLKYQVQTALTLIKKNPSLPVLVLSLPGFDTHRAQLGKHNFLLNGLDKGIEALSDGLKKLGEWNSSLILTYSEFGRRVQENESLGTDHGTANVFFALGGKVKGDVYGKGPSLGNLEEGNLIYTTDYRSVYESIHKNWFKFKKTSFQKKELPFI